MFDVDAGTLSERRIKVLAKALLGRQEKLDPLFAAQIARLMPQNTDSPEIKKAKSITQDLLEQGLLSIAEEMLQAVDILKAA